MEAETNHIAPQFLGRLQSVLSILVLQTLKYLVGLGLLNGGRHRPAESGERASTPNVSACCTNCVCICVGTTALKASHEHIRYLPRECGILDAGLKDNLTELLGSFIVYIRNVFTIRDQRKGVHTSPGARVTW